MILKFGLKKLETLFYGGSKPFWYLEPFRYDSSVLWTDIVVANAMLNNKISYKN